MKRWLGIDIGGTAIKAGIVDEGGSLLRHASQPTPAALGRQAILDAALALARELLAAEPSVAGVGIGSAGRIDSVNGTVRYATENLPGWTGLQLSRTFTEALQLPVCADNDVNAAAVGEGWVGAAAGIPSFALLALGTGVGGALVHNHQILGGASGGAAEFGHMILHPGGRPCNCGRQGCLEQYVSGTALTRSARAVTPEWDSRLLMNALAARDKRAAPVIAQFVDDLATAIINVVQMFDPETVVIGGGLADSRQWWWDKLLKLITLAIPGGPPLLPAALGNHAGVTGAARLAMLRS